MRPAAAKRVWRSDAASLVTGGRRCQDACASLSVSAALRHFASSFERRRIERVELAQRAGKLGRERAQRLALRFSWRGGQRCAQHQQRVVLAGEIARRHSAATIFSAINLIVTLLVVLQLWLLTATMNAYLGGDTSVVRPAALASLACLAVNLWLLRRVFYLQGPEG